MDEKRQNREIKFRAWNAKEQLMSDPFGLIRGTLMWRKKGETAVTFASIFPEYVVMQFTGFKIDGIELYEDDRVECLINGEPVGNPDRIGFESGSFILKNRNITIAQWLYADEDNDKTLRIIGNIYQPELSES